VDTARGEKTVFFAEVAKSLRNRPFWCGRGNEVQAQMELLLEEHWAMRAHPQKTHTSVRITCPAENEPSLMFEGQQYSCTLTKPPESPPVETCMVEVVAYDTPPLLDYWLQYQSRLKPSKIVIYTHRSFQRSPVYKALLLTGFVEEVEWTSPLNDSHIHKKSQYLAMQDFQFRYRSICKFFVVLDLDDFLVLENGATLGEFLTLHNSSYYRFPWVHMHPACGLDPHRSSDLLDQVTHIDPTIVNSKYIVRVSDKVVELGMHFLWGGQRFEIPKNSLAAHMRFIPATKGKPPGNCGSQYVLQPHQTIGDWIGEKPDCCKFIA
jgi:hypothetical protein